MTAGRKSMRAVFFHRKLGSFTEQFAMEPSGTSEGATLAALVIFLSQFSLATSKGAQLSSVY